jgi:CheY-like chemotaxis protein
MTFVCNLLEETNAGGHMPVQTTLILLIDDSDGDAQLAKTALKELAIECEIHRIDCGLEAIVHLQECSEEKIPQILFIDVNMTRITGCKVALALRSMPKFDRSIIIMTSTVDCGRNDKCCTTVGANSFLYKSSDFNEYTENMKNILIEAGYLNSAE